MWRILSRALLLAVFALILLAIAGPLLLIDPSPIAERAPALIDQAAATHAFVTIPVSGTQGLRIHYRDSTDPEGDAIRPLGNRDFVLLHGFTFNLSTWDGLFASFARHGRTLAFDQLPYGLSEKPLPADLNTDNPYAKESSIEQVLALMDALEMPSAILVGNSSGGTLALEVALRAPDRVSGLILINPWIYSPRPTLPDWLANTLQMERISLLGARYLGRQMPLLERSYAVPERLDEARRERAASHTWSPGWDLAWGALLNRSLIDPVKVSEALARIEQPSLMIAGAEDRIVPLADAAQAAATMPNAEFAVLPGCGHVPQEECPILVSALISDWLRRR